MAVSQQAIQGKIQQANSNPRAVEARTSSIGIIAAAYEDILAYAKTTEGTPEEQRALARAMLTAYFMPSEA